MALLERNLKCDKCGKTFDGVRAVNRDPEESWRLLCGDCLEELENDNKRKWLKKLRDDKTLEQRVEFIEEFIYHVIHQVSDVPDMELK